MKKKNIMRMGLVLLSLLMLVALVSTVNATFMDVAPTLEVEWAGETSVLIKVNQTTNNWTIVEYKKYTVADDTQWNVTEGTNCFNSSSLTSLTLEGLDADALYYFQVWNRFDTVTKDHADMVGDGYSTLNNTYNIRLPPASASDGGGGSSGLEGTGGTGYTPPATLTDGWLTEENTPYVYGAVIVLIAFALWKFGLLKI